MKTGSTVFLPVLFIFFTLFSSCVRMDKVPESDQKIILGIFGGMGPEATADLFHQIVRLTPAETNQEHIPTLI